jgi:hypothetical protein
MTRFIAVPRSVRRSPSSPARPGAAAAPGGGAEVPTRAERARTERTTFLEMYARAYFPGRSGRSWWCRAKARSSPVRARTCRSCTAAPGATTRASRSSSGARATFAARAHGAGDAAGRRAHDRAGPRPAHAGRDRPRSRAALRPGAPAPKAAVLLVLDGFRADYLDRHASVLPNLTRCAVRGPRSSAHA